MCVFRSISISYTNADPPITLNIPLAWLLCLPESNIPLWLTLPMLGCIAVGVLLTLSGEDSGQNTVTTESKLIDAQLNWVGPMYLIAGGKHD